MHAGPPYFLWERAVPPAVCEAIVAEWDESVAQAGEVVSDDGGGVIPGDRRVAEISYGPTHWVQGIVWNYANLANDRAWGLEVAESDSTVLLRYTPDSHFVWHQDVLAPATGDDDVEPSCRRLSVILNLTDPSGYEGGILRFRDGADREITDRRVQYQGSITVFPSDLLHKVEPLTHGERFTVVSWILGPQSP